MIKFWQLSHCSRVTIFRAHSVRTMWTQWRHKECLFHASGVSSLSCEVAGPRGSLGSTFWCYNTAGNFHCVKERWNGGFHLPTRGGLSLHHRMSFLSGLRHMYRSNYLQGHWALGCMLQVSPVALQLSEKTSKVSAPIGSISFAFIISSFTPWLVRTCECGIKKNNRNIVTQSPCKCFPNSGS